MTPSQFPPIDPRALAEATGDYAAAGMTRPADEVPPVLSWRSLGIVAAFIFALAALSAFVFTIGA